MMSAFVMIQLGGVSSVEEMRAVHNALHAVEGVKTVHFLAGPTDVIAFVEGGDHSALVQAIGKLRSVKGVASTDTRIVLPM